MDPEENIPSKKEESDKNEDLNNTCISKPIILSSMETGGATPGLIKSRIPVRITAISAEKSKIHCESNSLPDRNRCGSAPTKKSLIPFGGLNTMKKPLTIEIKNPSSDSRKKNDSKNQTPTRIPISSPKLAKNGGNNDVFNFSSLGKSLGQTNRTSLHADLANRKLSMKPTRKSIIEVEQSFPQCKASPPINSSNECSAWPDGNNDCKLQSEQPSSNINSMDQNILPASISR